MRFLRLPAYVLAALVAVASVAYGEVTRVDVTSRKHGRYIGLRKDRRHRPFRRQSEGPAQQGHRRYRQSAGECQRPCRIFGRCGDSAPARRLEIQWCGAHRRRQSWAQDDHDELQSRCDCRPGVRCGPGRCISDAPGLHARLRRLGVRRRAPAGQHATRRASRARRHRDGSRRIHAERFVGRTDRHRSWRVSACPARRHRHDAHRARRAIWPARNHQARSIHAEGKHGHVDRRFHAGPDVRVVLSSREIPGFRSRDGRLPRCRRRG